VPPENPFRYPPFADLHSFYFQTVAAPIADHLDCQMRLADETAAVDLFTWFGHPVAERGER
jgi:hypothetical protein